MARPRIGFPFVALRGVRSAIFLCVFLTTVSAAYSTAAAQADSPIPPALPEFAQLEAAGAIIGRIHIKPENIFDLDDEAENNWLYRQANRWHVPTRPGVIERVLLFKSGERVSQQKIEETERLLRRSSTRYDVNIKPLVYRDGVVDIEVSTRDTWSLEITANYSRAGGDNKTSFGIKEDNLLGAGMSPFKL